MCPHEMFRLWQNCVFWLKLFTSSVSTNTNAELHQQTGTWGLTWVQSNWGNEAPCFHFMPQGPKYRRQRGPAETSGRAGGQERKGECCQTSRRDKDPWSPLSCRRGSWSDAQWLSPPHLHPAPGSKEPIIVQKSPRKAFLSAHWKTELNAWSY